MGDLYEDDFLLWSESQAILLRRLAAGERVNDRDLRLGQSGRGDRGRGTGRIAGF